MRKVDKKVVSNIVEYNIAAGCSRNKSDAIKAVIGLIMSDSHWNMITPLRLYKIVHKK